MTHVDTSSLALKTNLPNLKTEADKLDIERLEPVPVHLNKLSDVVKKTKVTELANKIPDVISLTTETALTVVENK